MPKKKSSTKRRFSFSLLNLNCPRRIHRAMQKAPPEVLPSEETDQGRQIHRILADILSKKKEEWDFASLYDAADIYGDTERALSQLEGEEFSTEKKIRIKVNGRTFTVVPDLVVTNDSEKTILDHKSGFCREVIAPYESQLQYYALPFLREGFRVKIGVHFVRWANIQWIDVLEGLDDYTFIMSKLMEDIQRTETILQEKPIPLPSNRECSYCGYCLSCPSKPEYLISNGDEAVKLAGDYIKAKAQVKKMESLLKVWVNRLGNIRFNGSEIGYRPSNKTVIDDEATLQFLQSNNIPVTEIFVANATRFKKLARQYDDLSSFCEIETGSRWGVRTIKEGEEDE